jgi:acetyltransferase
MRGDNLLVLTNGGGVGVLATDSAEKAGIPMKFAPKQVQEELKKHMPSFGSAKNPVDLTGMAGNDWYYDTTKFSFAHDWVDGLVVLYCETAITNPMEIAKSIQKAVSSTGITNKPVTVSFVGGERSDEAMQWLVENGIPAYNAPDLAVKAMGKLRHYARLQDMKAEPVEEFHQSDKETARIIIADVRADGRTSLTEIESKMIFSAYGLPVVRTELATSEDEAAKMAEEIGYPVVLKIVSPDILHKSDAGGVKVDIKNEAGVREAYQTILENAKKYKADANIHGIVIQEMAPWATETIVGSVNDPTFGATVMFGLGGIFVEVLKDVTFRVAPISTKEAQNMLNEIKGSPILDGTRGEAPRDKEALAKVLTNYAFMITDLADEISESDANPVLVYEQGKGVKVVDARIILKEK